MKKLYTILLLLVAGISGVWADNVEWESKEGWEAASGGFGNFKWIGVHTPGDATQLYSFNELRMRFRKTGDDDEMDNYLAIARVSSTLTLSANHVVAVSSNHLRASADNSLETFTFDDDVVLLGGTTYYLVFVQSNTPTDGSYTVRACRLTLNHTDYGEYPYGNSAGSTGKNYWIYYGATLTPSAATGYCTGDILGGSMESGNWKQSWTSGTTPSFTITCPNANINNADSKPAGGLDIRSGTAKSAVYTITVPTGYLITGYKLFGNAITAANTQTVTPAQGGSAVGFTGVGNSLCVSGLNSTTASFTLTGENSGLFLHALNVSVIKDPAYVSELSEVRADRRYTVTPAGRSAWAVAQGGSALSTIAKLNLAASSTDVKQQFAFVTPDNGENYYLYCVGEGKYLTSSNTLTTNPAEAEPVYFADASSYKPRTVRVYFSESKNINVDGNNKILIDDWNTADDGCAYYIQEAFEFDPTNALDIFYSGYSSLIDELNAVNWSETDAAGQLNRYNLTDAYAGYAGQERDFIAGMEDAGYSKANFTIVSYLNSHYALNMPQSGKFYRIQGHGGTHSSNNYLASGMTDSRFSMTDANDATTVFYYDGTKLTNLGSGMCNGMNKDNWEWVTGDNASVVTFQDGLTNGGYVIQSADNAEGTNGAYLYDAGTSANRGSNMTISTGTDDRYTHWYLTEVTSLPLTIAADNYTSFSAPVPVTIPDNCYAYIATSKGDDVINMEKVTGNVAANTGLIISTFGCEGNPVIEIAESGEDYSSTNLLKDNVAALNISKADNYFFGKQISTGNYIFTKLSGNDDYQLPGFKAYLQLEGSPARMSVNWGGDDATGLKELVDEKLKLNDGKYCQDGKIVVVRNGIRYNLSGQTIK